MKQKNADRLLCVVDHEGRLVADSRDVAPLAGKNHGHLLRDIRRYVAVIDGSTNPKLDSLEYFIPSFYNDEKNQSRPYYLCTQMGCDMIAHKMTGEKGVLFTAAYVKAFHAMRRELEKRKQLRAEGKPIRRGLTDALRDSGENERMHGHAYEAYTDLALRLATGKSARQLRKARGAARDAVALGLLTSEELERYQKEEAAVAVLVDAGMTYDQVKAALS